MNIEQILCMVIAVALTLIAIGTVAFLFIAVILAAKEAMSAVKSQERKDK